jgi:hypothetical protein
LKAAVREALPKGASNEASQEVSSKEEVSNSPLETALEAGVHNTPRSFAKLECLIDGFRLQSPSTRPRGLQAESERWHVVRGLRVEPKRWHVLRSLQAEAKMCDVRRGLEAELQAAATQRE